MSEESDAALCEFLDAPEVEEEPKNTEAEAQFHRGNRLHARGDVEEAAKCYKVAADEGHAKAQVNYGVCLVNASGVKRCIGEAARYFRMAAEKGDAKGEFNYG